MPDDRPTHPLADPLADPRALTILVAEHSGLNAARALAWNESFSRTSTFFTSLSAAGVASALVGQATGFGAGFSAFVLVVLPLVLFLGLATLVRLGQTNNDDLLWVYGANRIRGAYGRIVPGIEDWFVTGVGGGPAEIARSYGMDIEAADVPGGFLHGFVTTPAVVGTVDAAVAAVIGGYGTYLVTGAEALSVVVGLAALVAGIAASIVYGRRTFLRMVVRLRELEAAAPPIQDHRPA